MNLQINRSFHYRKYFPYGPYDIPMTDDVNLVGYPLCLMRLAGEGKLCQIKKSGWFTSLRARIRKLLGVS